MNATRLFLRGGTEWADSKNRAANLLVANRIRAAADKRRNPYDVRVVMLKGFLKLKVPRAFNGIDASGRRLMSDTSIDACPVDELFDAGEHFSPRYAREQTKINGRPDIAGHDVCRGRAALEAVDGSRSANKGVKLAKPRGLAGDYPGVSANGASVMYGDKTSNVPATMLPSSGAGLLSEMRATARQTLSREVPPKGLEECPPSPEA